MRKLVYAPAACLCAMLLISQAALGQGGANPIGVIKGGGTPEVSMAAARAGLIAEGEPAVSRIVGDLLTPAGSSITSRLNAAICLAEIAKTGTSAALKDGLVKCAQDESPGVKYWGLIGLSRHKGATDEELATQLATALDWNQPRMLRLTAVDIARDRKLKAAAPYIMFMLEKLGTNYIIFRSQTFWALRNMAGKAPTPVTTAAPEEPALPEQPTLPTYGPPAGFGSAPGAGGYGGYRDAEDAEVGWTGGMPYSEEVALPAEVLPTAPAAVAKPGETVFLTSKQIDNIVQACTLAELQAGTDALEASPDVNDIRRIGAAVEIITEQAGDNAWGFTTVPSWQLQAPLLKALTWFKANRKSYLGGPKLAMEARPS